MLTPDDPLVERLKTVEGTRPQAAPLPSPGVYWIKVTSCGSYWIDKTGSRLENPTHNEVWRVYTWDTPSWSEWLIGEVTSRGEVMHIGTDCAADWESSHEVTTHVGPTIEYAEPRESPLLQCVTCRNTESPAGAMARYFNNGRCVHCGGYFKVVRA